MQPGILFNIYVNNVSRYKRLVNIRLKWVRRMEITYEDRLPRKLFVHQEKDEKATFEVFFFQTVSTRVLNTCRVIFRVVLL